MSQESYEARAREGAEAAGRALQRAGEIQALGDHPGPSGVMKVAQWLHDRADKLRAGGAEWHKAASEMQGAAYEAQAQADVEAEKVLLLPKATVDKMQEFLAPPPPGPLVPPKWAAVLAGGGLGLAVLVQFAPQDLQLVLAACASVAVYAGTGELPQPGIVKRLGALVPAALVPGVGLLATGAHAWAVDAHQPLLHVLGTTLAVVAGTTEQPTVKVGGGA